MSGIESIRDMTRQELAVFGMQDVAYIKPVMIDGTRAYAVHAADGTEIAVLSNRDLAFATVRQHDIEPVSVH